MARIIEKSQGDLVNFDLVKEIFKDWEFRARYTSTPRNSWTWKPEDTVYTLSDIKKLKSSTRTNIGPQAEPLLVRSLAGY